jgi:hypothetical protein
MIRIDGEQAVQALFGIDDPAEGERLRSGDEAPARARRQTVQARIRRQWRYSVHVRSSVIAGFGS